MKETMKYVIISGMICDPTDKNIIFLSLIIIQRLHFRGTVSLDMELVNFAMIIIGPVKEEIEEMA
jgi:hypothetical protein